MYNMNEFGTETMYDYYIAMKSMFLVAKLFYHPFMVYASFNFLLPWSQSKPFKTKSLSKLKLQFSQTCIPPITLYKWRCFSRSQTPLYILTKRKLIKKLPKTYPPQGSPNNQKETKSHGSPWDATINHKGTISHSSPWDFTINHKGT